MVGVEQALAARAMTGGEAVVRALHAHGVELVFGIPGTHTLPIHRHLQANGIRHVTPRHEQGGGYAADGCARVAGRPGVVVATSGPGVINTATPAATAYADSVPMLIVSPAMPTGVEGRDTGFLHEGKDQRGAMDALVSWSRRARSPADAATAIGAAFEHLAAGRPRPVHVEVPVDVLGATEEVRLPAPSRTATPRSTSRRSSAPRAPWRAPTVRRSCSAAAPAGRRTRPRCWRSGSARRSSRRSTARASCPSATRCRAAPRSALERPGPTVIEVPAP